jgi:hypothetical protein
VFPVHLSVGEARLRNRRIFTGIIHDLTQRNRLQEQLAQSQKMEAVETGRPARNDSSSSLPGRRHKRR